MVERLVLLVVVQAAYCLRPGRASLLYARHRGDKCAEYTACSQDPSRRSLLRTPAYIVAGPWPLLAATSLRRSSDDQMIPSKFCVVRVMAPSASFWIMAPSVVLENGTLELPWSFRIQRSVRRNGYLALSNFPVSGSVLD